MNADKPTHPLVPPGPQKPRTDWLSWSLQLIFGSFLGLLPGLFVAVTLSRQHFVEFEQILIVAASLAVFCGALTSYFGDTVSSRRSCLDDDTPKSPVCHALSLIIAACSLVPVLLSLGDFRHTTSQSRSKSIDGVFVVFGAVLLWFIIHFIRTGRVGGIDRDEEPVCFWAWIATAVAIVCGIAFT